MSDMTATFIIGKSKKRGELNLSKIRHSSAIIRNNVKTVIVVAPDGKPVKRHKIKHKVVLEDNRWEDREMPKLTDYDALKRALKNIGIPFEEDILHDGKRCISVYGWLSTLNWHFDYVTGAFVGNFVWNQTMSLTLFQYLVHIWRDKIKRWLN